MNQIPQKLPPILRKNYDVLILSCLHGNTFLEGHLHTTIPFLTYYAKEELLFPFQEKGIHKKSLYALFTCRFCHLENFKKPPAKISSSAHTFHIL